MRDCGALGSEHGSLGLESMTSLVTCATVVLIKQPALASLICTNNNEIRTSQSVRRLAVLARAGDR
jgi:hypothetical protein